MSEWWKNELYSQFGEDGILLGYFRSRSYGKTGKLNEFGEGFYVDIGAHHPYMLSNTWFFYQLGWRGITVDPTPGTKQKFDEIRPNDINLQLAISDSDGTATFYIHKHGVQNTLDSSREARGGEIKKTEVQTMRLSTLLDQYLPDGKNIDILSVDVEGLDLKVLQSNDWDKYRPEIVVTEDHSNKIELVLKSEIYQFMRGLNYELFGWAQPSLIFRRK